MIAVRIGTELVQSALTANLSDTGHENIFLVSPDGLARSPSVVADAFEMLSELPDAPHIAVARKQMAGQFEDVVTAAGRHATAVVIPLGLSGFNWSLVMETDSDTAFAMVYRIRWMVLSLIGASFVVSIIVSWAAANRVTRPIHHLRDVTNALASKDYDIDITGRKRGDEFGDLARSLDTFRDKLKSADEASSREEESRTQTNLVVDEMSHALSELQEGNLVCEITNAFSPHYEELRKNYNRSLENLRRSLREVVEAAHHVDRFSQEQRAAANEMAERTESQGATLEKTASAMQDLTKRLRDTAEKATEVDSTMRGTRREAEQSNEVVRSAVAAMGQIQQASAEISKIINLIDDIAFQTNLLALNAERRGGPCGRSGCRFCGGGLRGTQPCAARLRSGGRNPGAHLGERRTRGQWRVYGRSRGRCPHQHHSTGNRSQRSHFRDCRGVQHQSQGLEDINAAMRELDAVTQQNTAMAEEASASSQLLQSEANTLSQVTSRFQIDAPIDADAPARWEDLSDTQDVQHGQG